MRQQEKSNKDRAETFVYNARANTTRVEPQAGRAGTNRFDLA